MRFNLKRIDQEKNFDHEYFKGMLKMLSEYKDGVVQAYIYPPNKGIVQWDEKSNRQKNLFIIFPLIDRDKNVVFYVEEFIDIENRKFHSAYRVETFMNDDVRFDRWMLQKFINEYYPEISTELGYPPESMPERKTNEIVIFKNEVSEEDWKYFTREREYDKDHISVPEWSERYPKAYQVQFKENYFEAKKNKGKEKLKVL